MGPLRLLAGCGSKNEFGPLSAIQESILSGQYQLFGGARFPNDLRGLTET